MGSKSERQLDRNKEEEVIKRIVPHDIQYNILFQKIDSSELKEINPKSLSKSHTEISGLALESPRSNTAVSSQDQTKLKENSN